MDLCSFVALLFTLLKGNPMMQFNFTSHIFFKGLGLVTVALVGCTQTRMEAVLQEPTAQSAEPVAQTSPATTAPTTPPSPTESPTRRPDVIYVPTPRAVVEEMLRLADVQSDDLVYDLGSGDGRIVIAAARDRGARGIGIDIDPRRVREATENAKIAGVSDRVEFRQQDLFETDFSDATVITLYLLPDLNLKLRPKILQLKPGTRVVSHSFDMGDWKPEQVVEVDGRTIYYWTVPENPPANLLQ
jgi:SAM-dependent methyltransferase